jgi:hypothetical protein
MSKRVMSDKVAILPLQLELQTTVFAPAILSHQFGAIGHPDQQRRHV